MPWNRKIRRISASECLNRRPRPPFDPGDGDLPLLKAFNGAILVAKPPESGECRISCAGTGQVMIARGKYLAWVKRIRKQVTNAGLSYFHFMERLRTRFRLKNICHNMALCGKRRLLVVHGQHKILISTSMLVHKGAVCGAA